MEYVIVLSYAPMQTIEGIKAILNLKGNKAEDPEMYLRSALKKFLTVGDTACWSMSLEKYVWAAVTNLEERFIKTDHRLPS